MSVQKIRTLHAGRVALVVAAVVAVTVLSVGCKAAPVEPTLDPQIEPPAIVSEGVLTVGVNLGSAPYATESGNEFVGIDAELAQEIATNLGLTVEFEQVAPDEVVDALDSGRVDVVMSAPVDSVETSVAGSYIARGSAIYASEPTESPVTPSLLGEEVVAVQQGSPAYWWFVQHRGEESVKVFDSAAEALGAVASGDVKYAAIDSVVGAYALASGEALTQVGWVVEPVDSGIAYKLGKSDLGAAIMAEYDKLDAAGWVEALVRRWLEPISVGSEPATDTSSEQ